MAQLQSRFPDWTVVGTFYAALHYVDAYFALRQFHPPTHHQRSAYLARMREVRTVYPEYRMLEDISRDARYTNQPITPEHVTSSVQTFRRIKTRILPLLPTAST